MDKKTAERNIKLQTWINFLSGVVFLFMKEKDGKKDAK